MSMDAQSVKKAAYDMAQKYRRVFGTVEGREVLHDLLDCLSLFEPLATEELVVRHNFAKALLSKITGMQEMDTRVITDAYLNFPLERVEEE